MDSNNMILIVGKNANDRIAAIAKSRSVQKGKRNITNAKI